jgi:hypothetical protein
VCCSKKKNGPVVGKALEKVFDEIKSPITKIQADSGTEFIGNKNVFLKHKILFKTKHLKNKAAMAEHAIYLVKRKLYMIMRSENSKNWVKYLPVAVKLLNERPVKRIGNLAPASINSMFDDVKVREAQKLQKQIGPEEPTWREQNTLQAKYEKSPGFQKDDFVYLDYKEDTFAKSFNPKISIFIFYCVDSYLDSISIEGLSKNFQVSDRKTFNIIQFPPTVLKLLQSKSSLFLKIGGT